MSWGMQGHCALCQAVDCCVQPKPRTSLKMRLLYCFAISEGAHHRNSLQTCNAQNLHLHSMCSGSMVVCLKAGFKSCSDVGELVLNAQEQLICPFSGP